MIASVCVASVVLLAGVTVMPSWAIAKECADPPRSQAGRCAKAAKGYCDLARGIWMLRDKAAFDQCMSRTGGSEECADPPLSQAGRCAKAAKGYCDLARGIWMWTDKEAFDRCMSAK
jgi:hypothetical protein